VSTPQLLARSLLVVVMMLGCATGGRLGGGPEALRFSELAGEGDATRRASLRLCADGLDADVDGRRVAALGQYERAIQIDPTNPYAYLVLARHEIELGDPARGLEYLSQSEMMLESENARSPEVEAHLVGLRGVALRDMGGAGEDYLEQARHLAPAVWDDGKLTAAELR